MKSCYDDIIYAWLTCNSYKGVNRDGEEIYFVYKDTGSCKSISKATETNIRTTRRRLNSLIDGGFIKKDIVYNEEKTELYDVLAIESLEKYQMIPIKTLKLLVDTRKRNIIKIYAYLLNKSLCKKGYEFSKAELIKKCLGVKCTNDLTYLKKIDNILTTLIQHMKLIALYNEKSVRHINGKRTFYFKIKSCYTRRVG